MKWVLGMLVLGAMGLAWLLYWLTEPFRER